MQSHPRRFNPATTIAGAAFAMTIDRPALAAGQAAPGDAGAGFGYGYGPHMMWWDGAWHTMFLGPFFLILLLGAIVAMIALALRALGPARRDPAQHPLRPRPTAALDILQERFARGEIDEAEYRTRRKVLTDE